MQFTDELNGALLKKYMFSFFGNHGNQNFLGRSYQ